jgi:hypothetical protein
MFGGRPQMMTGSSSSTAVGSKGGATTTLYVLLLDRAEVPKQAPMVPFCQYSAHRKVAARFVDNHICFSWV